MYESLKYYVLKAWSLGLTGDAAIEYVVEMAGCRPHDVVAVLEELSNEMS